MVKKFVLQERNGGFTMAGGHFENRIEIDFEKRTLSVERRNELNYVCYKEKGKLPTEDSYYDYYKYSEWLKDIELDVIKAIKKFKNDKEAIIMCDAMPTLVKITFNNGQRYEYTPVSSFIYAEEIIRKVYEMIKTLKNLI